MITSIETPQINVNDDIVTLVKWYVENDTKVNSGDIICLLESTKSTLEIESPVSGYIYHSIEENDTIAVGKSIGMISDKKENIDRKDLIKNHIDKSVIEPVVSLKAKKVMDDNGLDITDFEGYSRIKESDVFDKINNTKFDTKLEILSEISKSQLNLCQVAKKEE